jgi:hypothetical protein
MEANLLRSNKPGKLLRFAWLNLPNVAELERMSPSDHQIIILNKVKKSTRRLSGSALQEETLPPSALKRSKISIALRRHRPP